MKLLSWNCRGLGNPQVVRNLSRVVKEKKPTLVILMETKVRRKKIDLIRQKLNFSSSFAVDCIGRSGGLAMIWNDELNLEIQNYSQYHINAVVQTSTVWKITGFYGHPKADKRHLSWNLLKILAQFVPKPWLCLGDFNEILAPWEKQGGSEKIRSQMRAFQEVLEECQMHDMGFSGPMFTWTNCRERGELIKKRLDRGVANNEWREQFLEAELSVIFAMGSDHLPLFVDIEGSCKGRRHRPSFRHETRWVIENGYEETVKQAWTQPTVSINKWSTVGKKLEECCRSMVRWNRKMKEPEDTIHRLQQKLLEIQGQGDWTLNEEGRNLQLKLQVLLDKEHLHWRQRAKEMWLKNGDRNTRYYHECVKARRRANRISEILDDSGQKWRTPGEVESAFVRYFSNMFAAGPRGDLDHCMRSIQPGVTNEMNVELLREFTKDEIREALFQMAPLKAPRPDGFTAEFFQKNWAMIGDEVCDAISEMYSTAVMPELLNYTHIVLIPKTKSPLSVTEFRPISLCNVLYKLVSKVLANRLKRILPSIISPTQSAFIPGRLISDNILAAYETLHTMHTGLRGKKGYMAVKLDMSKAYDRVE
jgi:exonuclease III